MPAAHCPGYHPSKQPLTTMPVDPQLRALDIEIPTQPDVLVKLSLLMADEDIDLQAVSGLVETDMALAKGAGFVRGMFVVVVSLLILKTGYDAFLR